jgi:hypothetical protein
LKDKRNKIAAMDKKLVQLNGLIERIQNNNEEYQKIEQKVNSILTDKKMIILTAIISAVAALRNDPDKQLLIYDTADIPSMNAIISSSQNPESCLLLLHPHHKRILKLAEIYYDEFSKFVLDNTISQAVQKKDH